MAWVETSGTNWPSKWIASTSKASKFTPQLKGPGFHPRSYSVSCTPSRRAASPPAHDDRPSTVRSRGRNSPERSRRSRPWTGDRRSSSGRGPTRNTADRVRAGRLRRGAPTPARCQAVRRSAVSCDPRRRLLPPRHPAPPSACASGSGPRATPGGATRKGRAVPGVGKARRLSPADTPNACRPASLRTMLSRIFCVRHRPPVT